MEYKKPYTELFNALTDIIAQIDEQNYGKAREIIIEAQQRAEEAYIEQEE